MTDVASAGASVIERLRRRADGEALLAVAARHHGIHLVGGAVRDLLLGREPRELDVVVEGDAIAIARALGSTFTVHDRFGTATVEIAHGRVDVAAARRERYPAPGALPEVEPASLAEDLLRRDFSVNAIAVALGPDAQVGATTTAPTALDDLAARRLRVLHEQSFSDDPTRLLRLARYAARLDFEVEPATARQAASAIAAGALRTVSGGRIGAELRLAAADADAARALEELVRLGVLGALHPGLSFDATRFTHALALLPADGRRDLLALAVSAQGVEGAAQLRGWLNELEFPARERETIVAAACGGAQLAGALAAGGSPSQLWALLRARPPEAVALAGALGPSGAARRWLQELRHVRLAIDGNDLIAAGVAPGPEIGRRLEHTLALRLDGKLAAGRDAELRAALRG